MNFTLLRTVINFDQKGDPPNGFEVIQWQWNVPGQPFKKIASYNSLQGRLDVNEKIITWHTENNTVSSISRDFHGCPVLDSPFHLRGLPPVVE